MNIHRSERPSVYTLRSIENDRACRSQGHDPVSVLLRSLCEAIVRTCKKELTNQAPEGKQRSERFFDTQGRI